MIKPNDWLRWVLTVAMLVLYYLYPSKIFLVAILTLMTIGYELSGLVQRKMREQMELDSSRNRFNDALSIFDQEVKRQEDQRKRSFDMVGNQEGIMERIERSKG